jgi:hypothetical protein
VRAKAPPPVFTALRGLAPERLAPARFERLQRALCRESELAEAA